MSVLRPNREQVLQKIQTVLALILDVMDGEGGLDAGELLQMPVIKIQVNADQRSLPVIGVDDIRSKIDVLEHLKNGTGEEGEPLAVIIKTRTDPCA